MFSSVYVWVKKKGKRRCYWNTSSTLVSKLNERYHTLIHEYSHTHSLIHNLHTHIILHPHPRTHPSLMHIFTHSHIYSNIHTISHTRTYVRLYILLSGLHLHISLTYNLFSRTVTYNKIVRIQKESVNYDQITATYSTCYFVRNKDTRKIQKLYHSRVCHLRLVWWSMKPKIYINTTLI